MLKVNKDIIFWSNVYPFQIDLFSFYVLFSELTSQVGRPTPSTKPFEYGCAKTQTMDSGR